MLVGDPSNFFVRGNDSCLKKYYFNFYFLVTYVNITKQGIHIDITIMYFLEVYVKQFLNTFRL